MTVTITIGEATLNATRAALEERVKRLEAEVARYQGRIERDFPKANENDQRALVWNVAALHETKTAIDDLSEDALEQADPITAAKADNDRNYHDWQARGPEGDSDVSRDYLNREGDPYFNGAFG